MPRAAIRSDLLQFARFQESQQHSLHPECHLSDFIEEHRPEMRRFHLSRLVAVRTGETSLHMTEQLPIRAAFRKARAVDRRKDMARARTPRVNAASDDFLADTALTGDEHLGVGARHALHFVLQRMISGLRPTSSTLVFIRMPASELVRPPTSMPVAVIVMLEVSEKKVVVGV
jgi:hypothetical protein